MIRRFASFTGTRSGMTREQRETLRLCFERDQVQVLVHGDCVGADAEADEIARSLGIERQIYPSNLERFRAHCEQRGAIVMAPPKPPLVRNEDIVRASRVLYVASETPAETIKSGTWSCCRMARRHAVSSIAVIWPDGGEVDGRRSLLG